MPVAHLDTQISRIIARQLVDVAPIAANASRLVTLADGSSVSTVGSVVCNLRSTCNTVAVSLKSITIHILPELEFDVILGFPTIRKYELLIHFTPLFTGKNLQVVSSTRPSYMPVAHLDP